MIVGQDSLIPRIMVIAMTLLSASCASVRQAPIANIEHIGFINCFSPETVDAKGRPLSCETSAVESIDHRLMIVSDKETPEGAPSPTMWMSIPKTWADEVIESELVHEDNAVLRAARKIEALAESAEGDFVFATTDFNWPPDNSSTEPDPYNTLVYWPIGDIASARIAHQTVNNGVASSMSLRTHFAEALKSAKYPDGPPYFKIEGLAALPNRQLLFGIREIGVDYEHPEFVFLVLKTSYTVSADREVRLAFPFSVFTRVDAAAFLPSKDRIGLSSIEFSNGRMWFLTSREAPEGKIGHESFIWSLDVESSEAPTLVKNSAGDVITLPCKAEGMTVLPGSKLYIVCDEDRSPSSFDLPSGKKVSRRPGQGVYIVVGVQAVQR